MPCFMFSFTRLYVLFTYSCIATVTAENVKEVKDLIIACWICMLAVYIHRENNHLHSGNYAWKFNWRHCWSPLHPITLHRIPLWLVIWKSFKILDKWFSKFSVKKDYPRILLKSRFPRPPTQWFWFSRLMTRTRNQHLASTPDDFDGDDLHPTIPETMRPSLTVCKWKDKITEQSFLPLSFFT